MDVEQTYKTLQLTIEALGDVKPAMTEFKHLFSNCSTQFDNGLYKEANTTFQFILNKFAEFASFCMSLDEIVCALIEEKTLKNFHRLCNELEQILSALNVEMSNKNYVEISEIIHYDLMDIIEQYNDSFNEILKELEATVELIEV